MRTGCHGEFCTPEERVGEIPNTYENTTQHTCFDESYIDALCGPDENGQCRWDGSSLELRSCLKDSVDTTYDVVAYYDIYTDEYDFPEGTDQFSPENFITELVPANIMQSDNDCGVSDSCTDFPCISLENFHTADCEFNENSTKLHQARKTCYELYGYCGINSGECAWTPNDLLTACLNDVLDTENQTPG